MKNEICIVTKKNFLKGNFKCICLVTPRTCFFNIESFVWSEYLPVSVGVLHLQTVLQDCWEIKKESIVITITFKISTSTKRLADGYTLE